MTHKLDEKALAAALDVANFSYLHNPDDGGAFDTAIEAAISAYLASLPSPEQSAAQQPATEAVEGWKLVPVIPTHGMRKAGTVAYERTLNDDDLGDASFVYNAMLAAAPALSQSPSKPAGGSTDENH